MNYHTVGNLEGQIKYPDKKLHLINRFQIERIHYKNKKKYSIDEVHCTTLVLTQSQT